MDGFPQTEAQINLLKSLKVRPSLVCMFEQPEAESIRRLQARRIDPETGNLFNLEIAPPSNDKVTSRLSAMAEDKEDVIRARMNHWTA